jgi:hypothetical protein
MTVAAIRKKLHNLIDTANEGKLKEFYSYAEREIIDHEGDNYGRGKKVDLMKQASADPLFLADVREISEDFQAVDAENI